MEKPWESDYVDLRGWYRDDDSYSELLQNHPKLALKCPTCKSWTDSETGYAMSDGFYTAVGGERVICDCEMQNRLYYRYLFSGVEELYQRYDWDDYHGDPSALDSSQKYLRKHNEYINEGIGIFFTGGAGRGKTMLATLIAKELIKLGYSLTFILFPELLDSYVKTWSDYSERDEFERRMLDSQILIIDEVGKEHSNHPGLNVFDTVLRRRTNANRPTFVTTNYTQEEFYQVYKQYVMSLLTEQYSIVPVKGADYRAKVGPGRAERAKNGWVKPIV